MPKLKTCNIGRRKSIHRKSITKITSSRIMKPSRLSNVAKPQAHLWLLVLQWSLILILTSFLAAGFYYFKNTTRLKTFLQLFPSFFTSIYKKDAEKSHKTFFLAPYSIDDDDDANNVDYFSHDRSSFSLWTDTGFTLVINSDAKANKVDLNTLNEALNTVDVAEHIRSTGDNKKAARLYEHALALQPKHPYVLVKYGLFIEKVKNDLLAASSLYTKALVLWPQDVDAKKHFSRTLPLVEEIDSQMLMALDAQRQRFMRIPRHSPALKRLMRESYVEHVYHTVALEGNTMDLMQTRSILETRMAIGGKSVIEHNEILGLDAALRFINRTLIYKRDPLSLNDILDIHRRVYGYVDPEEAGQLRKTQVFVGGFSPCQPERIEHEMYEFIEWLSLESSQRIHPVELAALVHYKFIIIHPFIDGNGRTSRILMNLILMKAGFPPVIIRLEDRAKYYETLKMANDGDLRPFIRFVAACTDRTLDTYLQYTTEIDVKKSSINELNSNRNHHRIIGTQTLVDEAIIV